MKNSSDTIGNRTRDLPTCSTALQPTAPPAACPIQCFIYRSYMFRRRSQWPRGLRRRSAAARLLRSWVRIPPGAWMFVCCECCVLSSRGLCDELITRPEEPYRLWCVVVCNLETSRMRRPWPALGRRAIEKRKHVSTPTRRPQAALTRCLLSSINVFMQSWWYFFFNLSHYFF